MTDKERIKDLERRVDELVGLIVNLTIKDNCLCCYTDEGKTISKGEYIGEYCDLASKYEGE